MYKTIRSVAKKLIFLMHLENRLYYKRINGLILSSNVMFIGQPIIEVKKGCSIEIGENTIINSSNTNYHVNMYSPTKLIADRCGAKIKIGSDTRIHGTCLHAYSSVTVGDRCLIAANCQIMDGSGHDLSFDDVENRISTIGASNPIVIGNCVWIGINTIVLPGVEIGYGSVIAAGSVVTTSIPPMTMAAGIPAIVKKTFGKISKK